MAIKGITKNSISADIRAEHFASLFESIYGKSGICNIYQKLLCTKIDNNTVRLSSGVYSLSGYMVMVENGTSEDFIIDSGTAGLKRNDLLVAEFVRNGLGSGIDILTFKIIKGTSVVGTASDPALIAQTISAEGVTRQEALYRIMIDGTNITSVVAVAQAIKSIDSLNNDKASKTQENWIQATLINGWVQDNSNPVQYRKDEFGLVRFRGRAIPTNATNSTFVSLPVGYRPSRSVLFSAITGNTTPNEKIYVASGGTLVLLGSIITSNSYYCVDGLSFYAEV